jgi:hypothetical protein
MSNKVDFGTFRRPTGWIAWIRLYHHAENRILRNGKDDILFATKEAADAAAREEFFRQMNSPIVVESFTGPTTKRAAAKKSAEAIFRKGKRIPVERASA